LPVCHVAGDKHPRREEYAYCDFCGRLHGPFPCGAAGLAGAAIRAT
jgi:hypothetical protein